jgi:hypothetical protein
MLEILFTFLILVAIIGGLIALLAGFHIHARLTDDAEEGE